MKKNNRSALPKAPETFPGDRVLLGIFRKRSWEDATALWKTAQWEMDYGCEHCVISITQQEDEEYRKNKPTEQELPPEKLRKKPAKRKEVKRSETPMEPVVMIRVKEDVRIPITLRMRIKTQNVYTRKEVLFGPGSFFLFYMIQIYAGKGTEWLCADVDGSIIGKPITTWQMYIDGTYGVEVENSIDLKLPGLKEKSEAHP